MNTKNKEPPLRHTQSDPRRLTQLTETLHTEKIQGRAPIKLLILTLTARQKWANSEELNWEWSQRQQDSTIPRKLQGLIPIESLTVWVLEQDTLLLNIQGEEQDHSPVREDSLINTGDLQKTPGLLSTNNPLTLASMGTQSITKAFQLLIDLTFNNDPNVLMQNSSSYHLKVLPLRELSGTLAIPPAWRTSKA